MKRKYYLRGIGVGILFATIVLFTTYSVSGGKRMSDADVIKRAEELGMVKSSESPLEDLDKPADTDAVQTEDTQEPADTTQTDTTQEPADTTQTDATQEPADGSQTADTQESTDAPATEGKIVTFTIVSGMNSWNVATLLRDQGVIEDADDFDQYLEANGYSSSIVTGEYSITVGADYATIAQMITR